MFPQKEGEEQSGGGDEEEREEREMTLSQYEPSPGKRLGEGERQEGVVRQRRKERQGETDE